MKHCEHISQAMQQVLLNHQRGYTLWTSFEVDANKSLLIDTKFQEQFGTKLPSWKRQDRKQKGLPNGLAYSAPVFSNAGLREIILMATPEALRAPEVTPWRREKWKTCYPTFSHFVMSIEQRERGDSAMTWRIKPEVLGQIEKDLVRMVKRGDRSCVLSNTQSLVRLYPMFGGVRRQVRRLFRSLQKLWIATQKSPWPGPDPEALPMKIGFFKG